MTKQKKEKQQEVAQVDYKPLYLRALADYQNLEKRAQSQKEEIAQATKGHVVARFLPFLDNLDQAEIFIKDPGLAIVKQQFVDALLSEGLVEVAQVGDSFDPTFAEAVDVVEGTEDNKIVEVVKRGFAIDGRVIRPAQVKVSKKV